jgi:hypothetical protein
MVSQVSSVLERRSSATPRKRAAGSRLLLIGGAAFTVVLARWCAALAAVLLLIFAAWPGARWRVPVTGAGDFTKGLIWAGPNSRVTNFTVFGDNPGFRESHWRGLRNVSGNAFILTRIALLILLAVVALRTQRRRASAARPA